MYKSTKRTIAFICNMVIVALCALSIAAYFFMPFWKISIKTHIDKETMEELLSDVYEDDSLSDSDYHQIVGENGIDLTLVIKVETTDVLNSFNTKPKENVSNMLSSNIDAFDGTIGALRDISINYVHILAKDSLDQAILEQLATVYPELSNEEHRAMLNNAGVNDAFIEAESTKIVNIIKTGTATTDVVVDETLELVDRVCAMLLEEGYDRFENVDAIEMGKQSIADIVKDFTSPLEREDGTLDIDELVIKYLSSILDEEETSAKQGAQPLSVKTDSEDNEDAIEELKGLLHEKILERIDEKTAETVTKVMNVIAYAIFFTFFTWAYLIIKILAKLGKRNNTIRLGLPIVLGWLPCLILVFLPNLAASTLLKTLNLDIPFTLSMSFSSGSLVSFGVAVALLLFSIVYYNRLRKDLALEACPTVDDTNVSFTESAPSPVTESAATPAAPAAPTSADETENNESDEQTEQSEENTDNE
ncbi:MAG: hypothetical protein IKD47_02695 [Clostridia bacterium]|nr:hypothetical protein [Clostridia bacterium]